MRRLKRGVVWGFWLIVFIAVVTVFAIYKRPQPPVAELKVAREALHEAQKANADRYAREAYSSASNAYDSAMRYWAIENERFFLFRNYSKVDFWIAQAIENSLKAGELSGQRVALSDNKLKEGLAKLERQANLYECHYKHMPLPASVIKAHNKGVLKLSEAKFSWQNKRFDEAEGHLAQAESLLNSSNVKAEKIVREWFGAHGNWQKQVQQAIQMSKGGKKVILVDKLAHTSKVYQSGKVIRSFDVELGMNWMGDKQHKGDKATPEGIYRITQKKDGARTKFYRAMLLNYPNDDDRARFAAAKRNGSLPVRADIGGLIEIHGLGGKGVDWTDGCIALSNDDIDVLYRIVGVGTPVIIVGSVRSVDEILR